MYGVLRSSLAYLATHPYTESGVPEERRGADMKILIAEDDAVSRRILRSAVERLGHECLAADDGLEAWETYQNTADIEVVISDWMMPNMDGLELCRRVRALERERYPFFIILTALTDNARLVEGLRAGADEYLTKPLDREQLQARLAVASRITALHRYVSVEHERVVDAEGEQDSLSASKEPATEPFSDKNTAGFKSTEEVWDALVSQGRASEEQLQRALEVQQGDPRGFGQILVSLGIISETDLAKAQAQRLGLFYVAFDVRDVDPEVIGLVPEKALRKYGVVPLRSENGRLFVAMSDPTDVRALDDLGKISGYAVVPVVATLEDIRRSLTQLYGVEDQRDVGGDLGS
jgi:CheY-like chemotaxis protein